MQSIQVFIEREHRGNKWRIRSKRMKNSEYAYTVVISKSGNSGKTYRKIFRISQEARRHSIGRTVMERA
jgi:hypothetical protein